MHLGDHLSRVEEHEQRVERECHILQGRVVLKCLGCVHAHRDDADDGAGSQQGVHPLQEVVRELAYFHRFGELCI